MDINDSSLTIIVTILAALMGLSYPLLLQCIQRIDEKYNSILLVRRFKQEKVYKWYLVFLIATFISLIYLPLAPECKCEAIMDNFLIRNSAALFGLFLLCFLVFWLVRVKERIDIYYDPEELLKDIVGKAPIVYDEKVYNFYVEIFRYAIRMNDEMLLRPAYQCLCDSFFEYRKDKAGKPVEYPEYLYTSLRYIVDEYVAYQNNNILFLSNASTITDVLLDGFQNTLVSPKTQNFIWYTINRMLYSDKDSWVLQYWARANQYFSLTIRLRKSEQNPEFTQEKELFLKMHWMMGALIFYRQKRELLKEILWFSNEQPPHYYLIPGSLDDIMDVIAKLNENRMLDPFGFERDYPFMGINKGAYESSFIEGWLMRYMAILCVRLFDLGNYYDPLKVSFIDTKEVDTNEESIRVLTLLAKRIRELSQEDKLRGLFSKDNFDKAMVSLEALIQKIELQNNHIRENPVLSAKKIENFKNEVKERIVRVLDYYPRGNFKDNGGLSIFAETITWAYVDKERFAQYTRSSFSNLDVVMVASIDKKLAQAYSYIFLLNSSVKDYRIKYVDIFKAIEKLQLSSNHVIVLMGVYLGKYQAIYGEVGLQEKEGYYLYKGIKIFSIESERASIFILKKEDLPLVYFKPLENFNFVKPGDSIDESIQLYCNIQSDTSSTINKDKVSILLNAYIHYNERLRYIRLNVIHQLSDEGMDNFDEIQPINKFIV